MALSISFIVCMVAVLVLRMADVSPVGSPVNLYVQAFHIVLIVSVGVVSHRRRRAWLRHAYALDGRICVMCGYTLLAEHDGQPCPECGAKADLARYRRLWIEFAGGWKQWPVELEKNAAKTPPAPEP
jgi:ribosomal protein S27AE